MTSYLTLAVLIVALVMILAPVLVAILAMRGHFRATEALEIETEDIPATMIHCLEAAEEKLEALGFEYSHTQLSSLEEREAERTVLRYYWHPEEHTYAAAYNALEKRYPYPYNVTFSTIFEAGMVLETTDCVKHLQLPFPDICEHHDHSLADIDKQWEMHKLHCDSQNYPSKIQMNSEWCLQWQAQLIGESLHQMLIKKDITLDRKTGYYRLRFLPAYRMGRSILRGPGRVSGKNNLRENDMAGLIVGDKHNLSFMRTAMQNIFHSRAIYLTMIFVGLTIISAIKLSPEHTNIFHRTAKLHEQYEQKILQAKTPEEEYTALVKAGDFYQELGSNTNARINYRAAVQTALGAGFEQEAAADIMDTKLKLATTHEERVVVRKNVFVLLDEARLHGDSETDLAAREYIATHDIPAFSAEEKLSYAVEVLDLFTQQSVPNSEKRTLKISQHMVQYLDELGLSEEAEALRQQIAIHRRAMAERRL